MNERLFVRADATPEVGLGHFMRCLALAQAWLDAGGNATFIGAHDPHSVSRLSSEGISRVALEAGSTPADDLAQTLAVIPAGAPIVLDGYDFDMDFQKRLDEHGRLLVIDDSGHLPAYAGRILLNQSPAATTIRYLNAPRERLLGLGYALLERGFSLAPRRKPAVGSARRWLVTLGGADADNASAAICSALAIVSSGAELRLIVGPLNARRSVLEAFAGRQSNLELRVAPSDMIAELAWADLAISASGSTALQLARLGVPALLIALADNQVAVGAALDAAGAAVYLGRWHAVTGAAIATAAAELAGDAARRNQLGDAAQRMIDGRGAERVCSALAATSRSATGE